MNSEAELNAENLNMRKPSLVGRQVQNALCLVVPFNSFKKSFVNVLNVSSNRVAKHRTLDLAKQISIRRPNSKKD
jgi:hypothetical protein